MSRVVQFLKIYKQNFPRNIIQRIFSIEEVNNFIIHNKNTSIKIIQQQKSNEEFNKNPEKKFKETLLSFFQEDTDVLNILSFLITQMDFPTRLSQ